MSQNTNPNTNTDDFMIESDHDMTTDPLGRHAPNALGQYLLAGGELPSAAADPLATGPAVGSASTSTAPAPPAPVSPATESHASPFPVLNTPRFTPMETLHRRFATVWRGYRKEDVQQFLGELSQQLENHLQERSELYQQIQDLQQQLQAYRHSEDELRRTLVAAERMSHELREQTKQEAQLIVQEAEQKAALLAEQAATREREALITHDARMSELEATFSVRRATLEHHYQQQEHALETRARERSAQLEREFSVRYSELSGRLTNAHAEYANFMAQYRAVSQAFAQAANTQLLPENPALLSPASAQAAHNAPALVAEHPDKSKADKTGLSVLIDDQSF